MFCFMSTSVTAALAVGLAIIGTIAAAPTAAQSYPQRPIRVVVPLGERTVADAGELHDRRLAGVREVRIAVAEVIGQVEFEPLRKLAGPAHRVAVERETLLQLGRGGEDALAVASPLRLAAVQRRAAADRHQRVLERGAAPVVCVDVAGRDRFDPQRLGEVSQRRKPP